MVACMHACMRACMRVLSRVEPLTPWCCLWLQNKSKLLTYVIATGLTYGAGESIFHYLFKVFNSIALFQTQQYHMHTSST